MSEQAEKRLRCGDHRVVRGRSYRRSRFRPEGLRFRSLSFQLPKVAFPSELCACTASGLCWTEIDSEPLENQRHDLGNDAVKKYLKFDE